MQATSAFIPKRPIGAFRGSVLGFLAGACAVSAAGFYALFDKYTSASTALLRSVDEIRASSLALQNYGQRLASLEEQYKALAALAAGKEELKQLERDTRGLYDEVHLSTLDIKRAVWGLEEDTRRLLEERARTVRIS